MKTKSFLELITIPTFEERLEYLKLDGKLFNPTLGHNRHLAQWLYRDRYWRRIRDEIVERDNWKDLAHPEHEIYGGFIIHHINPVTYDDIRHRRGSVLDTNNLITVTKETHDIIHYGIDNRITITDRRMNDTCPWVK